MKFSFSGNEVAIVIKYIQCVKDLSYENEEQFVRIVQESKNGLLEIQVKDQGVGIKSNDIGKLFKIFGFL